MAIPIFLLVPFSLLICFLVLFKFYIFGNESYWKKRGVELVKLKYSLFGEAFKIPFIEIDQKIYKYLKALDLPYGGMVEVRKPVLFIRDTNLIKSVLVKDFECFMNRRKFDTQHDQDFLNSLSNMEDQSWKSLRTLITPSFTSGKLKKNFYSIQNSATKLIDYIKNNENKNDGMLESKSFDIKEICAKFTLTSIFSFAFSVDSDIFTNKNSIFTVMSRRINDGLRITKFAIVKFLVLVFFPKLFNLCRFRIMDKLGIQYFTQIIKKTIQERLESGKREDFLQMILDVREEYKDKPEASPVQLSEDFLISQCLMIFMGGVETTDTLLSFCLYELAINPEIQEKLYAEVRKVVEKENEITYTNIKSMEYLDMVISETLRKYPPAYRLERLCTSNYSIENTDITIEKGVIVVIPILAVHHDEELYPEPEKFLPGRFSSENKSKINPYHYMPFGLGPRSCVASRLALMQSKIAVANLILNFRFEPSEKTTIPIKFIRGFPGLRPVNGIHLKLKERKF